MSRVSQVGIKITKEGQGWMNVKLNVKLNIQTEEVQYRLLVQILEVCGRVQ